MAITNTKKLENLEERVTSLEIKTDRMLDILERLDSKGNNKSSNGTPKHSEEEVAEFNKKYDEAIDKLGVGGDKCRCYAFARPLCLSVAKGEITLEKAVEIFSYMPKPKWFNK